MHCVELEISSVSVHRITAIAEESKEEECYDVTSSDDYLRINWLKKADVTFKNVVLRYKEDAPPALQNLSLHIKDGERVGKLKM